MAPARDNEFLPEIWTLYSLGALWIILRFAVRIRTAGVRGLRLDDAFALVALVASTFMCASTQIMYYAGTNTDFTAEEVAVFDQAKFDEVEQASKLFVGSWYANTVLVFSLKAVVIVLYRRIFFQRWQLLVLKATTVLCISGFCGVILVLTVSCAAFFRTWQAVPPPSARCTSSPETLITCSCINAVTDVLLLSIPVSLLWELKRPLLTRLCIFFILASGVFVLAAWQAHLALPTAAVLTVTRWGVREFSVAIIAVNAASLRPMFRKSFWMRRSPALMQQKRAQRIFASVKQERPHLDRDQDRNKTLMATSVDISVIDRNIWLELGGEEFFFDEPDYQMTVDNWLRCGAPGVASGSWDLEKGGPLDGEVVRTDSGFPKITGGSDEEGDVSRNGSPPTQNN
ncbi:hypothetical protein EKO04_011526 [Ascochyta lentis]|uniref:Rhodopsin domain-containing protein n=1 Tax=Ascochyta lentis TaxID=205686 RepID=A0A8H7IT71_9PLEO|nr:hypothetical protein EKO04_011526 [Ascochyta lentis]